MTEKFNTIIYSPNSKKFIRYDVIPYFMDILRQCARKDNGKDDCYWKFPLNRDEFLEFIRRKGMNMFWSRCEYEIILSAWPPTKDHEEEKKIDVWNQIEANIGSVCDILMAKCAKLIENRLKKENKD